MLLSFTVFKDKKIDYNALTLNIFYKGKIIKIFKAIQFFFEVITFRLKDSVYGTVI
jgi:hypothetical protein